MRPQLDQKHCETENRWEEIRKLSENSDTFLQVKLQPILLVERQKFESLKNNSWQNGPSWLSKTAAQWLSRTIVQRSIDTEGYRETVYKDYTARVSIFEIQGFSCREKLKRVAISVLKFVKKFSKQPFQLVKEFRKEKIAYRTTQLLSESFTRRLKKKRFQRSEKKRQLLEDIMASSDVTKWQMRAKLQSICQETVEFQCLFQDECSQTDASLRCHSNNGAPPAPPKKEAL